MKLTIVLIALALMLQSVNSTDNAVISGMVLNKLNGKPLTGVLVKAYSSGKTDSAVTNRYGQYKLNLNPGDYKLEFTYFLHNDTTFDKVTASIGNKTVLDVVIVPNTESLSQIQRKEYDERKEELTKKEVDRSDSVFYTKRTKNDSLLITGKILDEDGKPISGATILIQKTKLVAYSKSDGLFKINNSSNKKNKLSPGAYDLRILSVGKNIKYLNVEIKPENTTNVIVQLNSSSVKTREVSSESSDALVGSSGREGLKSFVSDAAPLSPSKKSSVAKKSESTSESAPAPTGELHAFADVSKMASAALVDMKMASTSVKTGGSPSPNAKAGLLTSGEVNDFRKWDLWQDIEKSQLKMHKETWTFNLENRYTVQLVTQDNSPVVDCSVKLISQNEGEIWAGRTDNTGKAELWANIFTQAVAGEGGFQIKVKFKDKEYTINNVKKFHDGINIIKIDDYCSMPNNVDIAFLVDATGSMGDEINYLKVELNDIITKAKEKHKDKNFRVASVFYRDINDEYVVNQSDFNSDIKSVTGFIDQQSAGGGGDFPEAVEMGMMTTVNELSWNDNAITRIVFLIMDAPPHNSQLVIDRLKEITAKAALSGIRIVPVSCSGSDKSNEYIMRSIALATNGTYVFLTDHSGIGEHHIEPTTDKYDVELMNALFLRLIDQFTIVPECSQVSPLAKAGENTLNIFNQDEKLLDMPSPDNKDIQPMINCYPNPTKGDLNIEIIKALDELYITDITGKLIMKMDMLAEGKTAVNLIEYPTGIYFIKFRIEDKWGGQKVMLVH